MGNQYPPVEKWRERASYFEVPGARLQTALHRATESCSARPASWAIRLGESPFLGQRADPATTGTGQKRSRCQATAQWIRLS